MSKNRENVIWQSQDGTWNRGFFAFRVTGPDDEWDVDYDHNRFNWIATGLRTEDDAHESWPGANPGGYQRVPFDRKHRVEIARYERMAREFVSSRPRTGRQLDADIAASLDRLPGRGKRRR